MTSVPGADPYVGQRLRLSRTRGWRLPARARSVAYPTRWANPFRPDRRSLAANARAVEQYRRHLEENPRLASEARVALTGFDLACWCPPELPCHADVLLKLVADTGSTASEDLGLLPTASPRDAEDVLAALHTDLSS